MSQALPTHNLSEEVSRTVDRLDAWLTTERDPAHLLAELAQARRIEGLARVMVARVSGAYLRLLSPDADEITLEPPVIADPLE